MTMLLRIAERVLNRPLLIHPDKIPLILSVLEGRIPLGDTSSLRAVAEANIDAMPEAARMALLAPVLPGASRFVGSDIQEDPAEAGRKKRVPYMLTPEGVATITVTGSLVNRGAWVGSQSGATSYEGIKHQVLTAAADPKVRAILLDIESPGGEAVGAFEAASVIQQVSKDKTTVALVNGMAASAAYALASGAGKIITTPTGLSGSIGVVMVHADHSRALDAQGITPTFIYAGARKVDGNPLEPLSAIAREDLQADVDRFYSLFVKTVADGRGISQKRVKDTEARVYMGRDAVKAGLADNIGDFETTLSNITRGLR